MSPQIIIGADFDEVKKDTEYKPLPVGSYDFVISDCTLEISKKMKPMMLFTLSVVNNSDQSLNNKTLRYYAPLPATESVKKSFLDSAVTGAQNILADGSNSGVGLLIALLTALNMPWDTDMVTENFIGQPCSGQVSQSLYNDNIQNSVKF